MPNWCYNHLNVSGDKKQLQEFVEKSLTKYDDGEDRFIFNGTHHMAKELDITKGTQTQDEKEQAILNLANHGYTDWYEWRLAEWGTKWDASDAVIQHNEEDLFSISFATAWCPPIEWVQNIMHKFPDLIFELEYDEEGMGFGGKLEAQHDMIWDHRMYDIGYASDCCEYKVYHIDDEEYSLKEEDIKTKYGTDYQCSKCKEECETITMNEAEIKTNIKEIKNNEN